MRLGGQALAGPLEARQRAESVVAVKGQQGFQPHQFGFLDSVAEHGLPTLAERQLPVTVVLRRPTLHQVGGGGPEQGLPGAEVLVDLAVVDARLGRDLPKIDAGEDPVAVEETARGGQQVGLRLLELFERYDLLLLPTVPTTAWPAEGPDTLRAIREGTLPIAFTSIFNDTGHPAITVPAGLAPEACRAPPSSSPRTTGRTGCWRRPGSSRSRKAPCGRPCPCSASGQQVALRKRRGS